MISKYCPVCNSSLHQEKHAWHWKCKKCRYEAAEFETAINKNTAHERIDEKFREMGLRSLRVENFDKLLRIVVSTGKNAGDLLDVGCGHGWFLESAEKFGFKVLGIEPDLNIVKAKLQQRLPVREGLFPEALFPTQKFDVIVFNDVFEHMSDVNATLISCKERLKSGGVLVINLPSSTGFFYKCARVLTRLRLDGFFERLWQKDLPSPHLHYFNQNNLQMLLQNSGFEVIAGGQLETVHIKGLFTRISYTGDYPLFLRFLIFVTIVLFFPVLALMPSDIIYIISSKKCD